MPGQGESDKPIDRLGRVKPAIRKPRFLMSWDSDKHELWYGLGSGPNAVRVSSNRKLANWEGKEDFGAKLERETVQHYLESDETTDGVRLLHDCIDHLWAFVHLEDDRVYLLLAVWTLATYLYAMFSHFGYLFLHSRFPRSGKTRVEEVLSHLAFEACNPLNAPTVPTIRDTAFEGRTLVLDTLERWKGKSPEAYCAAMELLDAGFRSGGMVAKMDKDEKGKWKKQLIPVFAPYILAGIGRASLSDTALDRSFVIEMHRKKTAVKKRKYDHDRVEIEARPLRARMYLWALETAEAVNNAYRSIALEAEVDEIGLNDRAADIWRPLFAVLRVLDADACIDRLTRMAQDMAADPDVVRDAQNLEVIRILKGHASGMGTLVATTTQLKGYLYSAGLKLDKHVDLHALLTAFDFVQESARTDGGEPRRCWKIDFFRLQEIESELTTR